MGKGDGSLFPFLGKRDTFKEKGKWGSFLFLFLEKGTHSKKRENEAVFFFIFGKKRNIQFNIYNISIPSLVSEYIFTYLGYSNTKFKKENSQNKKIWIYIN